MQQKVYSASAMAERVANDQALQEQVKQDPVKALSELAAPLQTDVWIYRIVVGGLVAVLIFAVLGAIGLSLMSSDAPELLTALGSAAVGALAGLLAPSPVNGRG